VLRRGVEKVGTAIVITGLCLLPLSVVVYLVAGLTWGLTVVGLAALLSCLSTYISGYGYEEEEPDITISLWTGLLICLAPILLALFLLKPVTDTIIFAICLTAVTLVYPVLGILIDLAVLVLGVLLDQALEKFGRRTKAR
jgi:hypothetical protein